MASMVQTKIRVENFESWKSTYDAGEPVRREHGVRGTTILRDATDPNLLTILTRFDSVDAAKAMLASDKWRQSASRSGALPMEAFFTEIAEERSY